jgi:hypothetical protein
MVNCMLQYLRVTSKNGLKILIEDEDGNYTNETRNVVYKEVFSNYSQTVTTNYLLLPFYMVSMQKLNKRVFYIVLKGILKKDVNN